MDTNSMRLKPINNDVFTSDDPLVSLTRPDIDQLKDLALKNPKKRVRVCAHKTDTDLHQDMIIVMAGGVYIRPHKHMGKSESIHIIEGQADAVFFDDKGEITRIVQMGDYASGRCFYYRVSEPVFHSLIVRTPFLLFHESTTGPFDRSKSAYAAWAPDEKETAAVAAFEKKLSEKIAASK